MPTTRREVLKDVLKAGAGATALAALPRPLLAHLGARPEPAPPIEDPRLKDLAARALEAARAAGAAYADVRLTHTRERYFPGASVGSIQDSESMVVGVRALVQGYWGFASGPVWSADEMARLGREAVYQARTNALGKARAVELAPAPAVKGGHWVMPVKIDPFAVSPLEIVDVLMSLRLFVERFPGFGVQGNTCNLWAQEKAFASTEGSYCTQRLYRTEGNLTLVLEDRERRQFGGGRLDSLTAAGLGWELYRDQPLREHIRALVEEIREDARMAVKPVDVGRYDAVFDARSVAGLVDQTLGRATELDRALGYEANAGGTSYLNDPFAMLGTYQAGAPLLTVKANRSEPGGVATVKWDDEGVAPDEFPLVKDGVLADFQTTRESAGWLKAGTAQAGGRPGGRAGGLPFRSHGCANAPSALAAPLTRTPNLALMPGREQLDFHALVAGLSRGIAIRGAQLELDFQNLSGLALGQFYEVKQGKRVARLAGAGVLFRAPELWKGLLALGGPASARRYGMFASKGEPVQWTHHSVTAVPAAFKQLPLIDALRKA